MEWCGFGSARLQNGYSHWRFARSTKHLILALEEFRNLGIDFVSCQENNDTSSPLGGAIFTIIGAVTQTGARYHR